MGFKVAVTVTHKGRAFSHVPEWNKVHLGLDGSSTDLVNLQEQLKLVKSDVAQDMDRKGFKLKNMHVEIEFI